MAIVLTAQTFNDLTYNASLSMDRTNNFSILEMSISEQKCRFVDNLAITTCYGTIFLRLLMFSTMENSSLILSRTLCFRIGVLNTMNLSFRPKVDVWRINIDK